MTFEEFLKYVREEIGNYCTEHYWKWVYESLKDKSIEGIKAEMPFLAVKAVGTDYASKNAGKKR